MPDSASCAARETATIFTPSVGVCAVNVLIEGGVVSGFITYGPILQPKMALEAGCESNADIELKPRSKRGPRLKAAPSTGELARGRPSSRLA